MAQQSATQDVYEGIVDEAEHFAESNDQTDSGQGAEKAPASTFPELPEEAKHGIAGQYIDAVIEHTEASEAAILAQLLAGFGNIIGRDAFYRIGAGRHYLKLWALLVGDSSQGKKGTSWECVEPLLLEMDFGFDSCIHNGLSSGEGLINLVRDERREKKPKKVNGTATGEVYEEVVDFGADEKRAFIIESEFARVLQVMSRAGNTISPIIREAWDKDKLQVVTKTPIKATGAHIGIVGHITPQELLHALAGVDMVNGFANRFYWIAVKRSKYLPFGGDGGAIDNAIRNFGQKFKIAKAELERRKQENGGEPVEMFLEESARELWGKVYKRLCDGLGGVVGSLTTRAPAYVLRTACLYALLDCQTTVSADHIRAALALWDYCEKSALHIFGASTGNKIADDIIQYLQDSPTNELTKVELHKKFDNNIKADKMNGVLDALVVSGRVAITKKPTAGRPTEVIKLTFSPLNSLNSLNSFYSSKGVKK